MGKALRDHYLRIDARSLGLFRLAFGVVLLSDLFRRWRYVKEFYSNDGVLPNHNHLFNLRNTGQVWSFLHAFSSPGEASFAFTLILVVYVGFTLGWATRACQALALVALVSLTGRNILLENAGNYLAISLLAFSLFLPLGSRFSVDALRASLAARDEERPAELNDHPAPVEEAIAAARSSGWSPSSLAALALLVQIALVYLVTALQQQGAWRDGTALYYALNVERWVSGAGASARSLPSGVLAAWTRALWGAAWAIPVLIVIPAGFRWTRGAAVAASLFYGLTLGVYFSFGLYAWSLVAAAALLVPKEAWDSIERVPVVARARTVIYDVDCGVCLWLSRVVKRLDLRSNLVFQGNDAIDELLVRGKDGALERAPRPSALTAEVVAATVVIVDASGAVFTRSRAVAEVFAALPLGWLVAYPMRVPGISNLLDLAYDAIAKRRQSLSVLMGTAACGIPVPEAEAEAEPVVDTTIAPVTRTARLVTGALRELAALVVFAAMLAQTTAANPLPVKLPQPHVLQAVAAWPRMLARWDVLVPEPPKDDEIFVIDGQTRGNVAIDTLTGKEPVFDPGAMRGTRMGQLWGDFLYRMHAKEWADFQRAFRDYLTKSGPGWDEKVGDDVIAGLDAYWIKQPIPPPGQPRVAADATREKMFTHSRGGRLGVDSANKTMPLFRPDLNMVNPKR